MINALDEIGPFRILLDEMGLDKTTVFQLAIPSLTLAQGDLKVMAISLSQGGLKIPRCKELVARPRLGYQPAFKSLTSLIFST